MRLQTHYTNENGQHVLPLALQHRFLCEGSTIKIKGMKEEDVNEIEKVLRDLDFTYFINDDGDIEIMRSEQ